MDKSATTQNYRILTIYNLLLSGKKLAKKELAIQFQVSDKTIQRDFNEIRNYLYTLRDEQKLLFDKKQNYYYLQQNHPQYLLAEEILAISKILLEARAIPKEEMHQLLNKLLSLAEEENKALIESIIHNEKELYVNLHNNQSVLPLLWKIAIVIHKKEEIEIYYKKEIDAIAKRHHLQPVGILFSEYYFYLIAYQVNTDVDFPIIYRIDRITAMKPLHILFKVKYRDRFEEGEFRKRVQFMYTGDLLHIQFYFKGASIQAVLDRLPTATIIKQHPKKGYLVQAEVYGKGIQMWLLSQGDAIEVISPISFRQSMKETLENMLERYS